jgi:hypothetical protein
MRQNLVFVIQHYAKHRAGQHSRNGTLDLDWLFSVCQAYPTISAAHVACNFSRMQAGFPFPHFPAYSESFGVFSL